MSAACPIFGDLSYLQLSNEAAFGVQDAEPVYVYLPVLNYGVELLPVQRKPKPYTGMSEDFDTIVAQNSTAGQLVCPLYGWRIGAATISLAEYVMAWAFVSMETLCSLPSKSAEWAEGPNAANKLHTGLTANNSTLTGSDDNGGAITLTVDLLGNAEAEVATAEVIPATLEKLNEFLFSDAVFSIGADSGSLVAVEMKSFTWTHQRNLSPAFNGSFTPRRFRPGAPVSTFDINIEKPDDTWDAIRRSTDANNFYGRLVLQGLHNDTGDTGDYAKVVINFPKLAFNSKKDAWTRNGPVQETISFGVQKPTTSAASHTKTWSEV